MQRLKATIAYDGSAFKGFARQRTKRIPSVSERIESALRSMGITDEIIAAGRTDKGVHASAQIISFCLNDSMESFDLEKIKNLLNNKLYPHIFIRQLFKVPISFHPRFGAKRRGYRYIFNHRCNNPFISQYVSKEDSGDKYRIQEALNIFLGKHDFGYFKKQGSDTKSDEREIFKAILYEHKFFSQIFQVIYLEANGFLRAQVRLIIGAVFAYARGEIMLSDIKLQLEKKKRIFTCPVSPNGLYLARVIY